MGKPVKIPYTISQIFIIVTGSFLAGMGSTLFIAYLVLN